MSIAVFIRANTDVPWYIRFRFKACAREKKPSVGDAHRVFLRVVEIQQRKVRQYSKICVTLLFKTSKLSESEIPV